MASPRDAGQAASIKIRAPDTGRQRKAAGQRLAKADEIRHDAAVFAGKPFSGAAEAGVNFVQDQQRAVFVAESSAAMAGIPAGER